MPSVHIRDNLDLLPNAYRLTLMGVSVAEAEIYPDRELAINPGQVFGSLNGIAGRTRPSAWRRYGSSPASATRRSRWATPWWMRAPWSLLT